MIEAFKIFIKQLEGGQTEKIDLTVQPDFFEIQEKDLKFSDPVQVSGKAYLTEEHLILHLSASTLAEVMCCICNEPIKIPLKIENIYHTELLEDIKDGAFDFHPPLREALLLELPNTTECHNGACPERKSINNFLKKEEDHQKDDVHFPFSDLKMN